MNDIVGDPKIAGEGSSTSTAPPKEDEPKPKKVVQLRNTTLDYLEIDLNERKFRLAPLERKKTSINDAESKALREWEQQGLIYREHQDAIEIDHAMLGCGSFMLGLAITVCWAAYVAWTSMDTGRTLVTTAVVIAAIGFLILAITLFAMYRKEFRAKRGDNWGSVWSGAKPSLVMLLTVAFAVGMPLTLLHVFAPAPEPTALLPSLLTVLADQTTMMNYGCVVLLSVFPALLFFVFDHQRLTTLRERFFRDIMLMDRRLRTLTDVSAYYGDEMAEVFGVSNIDKRRTLPGTLAPIVGCTVVLSAGWYLALLYQTTIAETQPLLTPMEIPIVYGFLGAYFFTLGVVLRGHMRGDLRPKTFNAATTRIIMITILAWVLGVAAPDAESTWVLVVVFLGGIFPEGLLTRLQELARFSIPGLDEGDPLTKLDGIDLYDRSRLSEEGITNIEALAHHDLVQLMLRTRIPAVQLLDWVDQAVLYLHTAPRDESSNDTSGKPVPMRTRLRAAGIRTATDFIAGCGTDDSRTALAELVGGAGRLEILISAIKDDDWLSFIRNRKALIHEQPSTITNPKDFFAQRSMPPSQA